MCIFSVKTPKVSQIETTAKDLVSETTSQEPESPLYGGTEDTYNKTKGKNALKINKQNQGQSYIPLGL